MSEPRTQDNLVTVAEACQVLQLSREMIRKLWAQGRLTGEITPYGRAIYRESLEEERQRRVDEGKL